MTTNSLPTININLDNDSIVKIIDVLPEYTDDIKLNPIEIADSKNIINNFSSNVFRNIINNIRLPYYLIANLKEKLYTHNFTPETECFTNIEEEGKTTIYTGSESLKNQNIETYKTIDTFFSDDTCEVCVFFVKNGFDLTLKSVGNKLKKSMRHFAHMLSSFVSIPKIPEGHQTLFIIDKKIKSMIYLDTTGIHSKTSEYVKFNDDIFYNILSDGRGNLELKKNKNKNKHKNNNNNNNADFVMVNNTKYNNDNPDYIAILKTYNFIDIETENIIQSGLFDVYCQSYSLYSALLYCLNRNLLKISNKTVINKVNANEYVDVGSYSHNEYNEKLLNRLFSNEILNKNKIELFLHYFYDHIYNNEKTVFNICPDTVVKTKHTTNITGSPINNNNFTLIGGKNTHTHKTTKTQRHKDTKTQRHKDTKTQRHKDTKPV